MSETTLTDAQDSDNAGLHETIAAAVEADQDKAVIDDLSSAESEASETPETPGTEAEGLSDDGDGAETSIDDGGADQTEKSEPSSVEAAEDGADAEPEPDTDTGTADQYRQVATLFHDAVAPYREYLASKGVAPSQAVSTLLAVEYQLSTGTPERKGQILAKLAKDYGIDLYALADMADAEPANPEMVALHQRLGGIERAINGDRQQVATQAAAQVRQEAETQVTAFTEEKDSAGKLLRPHLEKVNAAMARMIEKDPKLTLERAYEDAVKADPKLRKAAHGPAGKLVRAVLPHSEADMAVGNKQRAKRAAGLLEAAEAEAAKEPSLRALLVKAHRSDVERVGT